MNSTWYKKMGIIGIVLMLVSGCGGQKEIEIVKDAQGLPSAEELILKAEKQIDLLKSFAIREERTVIYYENPLEKESADKLPVTSEVIYVKDPLLYHLKERFVNRMGEIQEGERIFTMDYGTYIYTQQEWEKLVEDTDDDLWQARMWIQTYENPYLEISFFENAEMTVERDGDNYKLIVIGVKHPRDLQRELTYIIDATTLLPFQKQAQVSVTTIDDLNNMSYMDMHIVITYDRFNKINSENLLKSASEIAQK